MKLCFLGIIRGKDFLTQFFFVHSPPQFFSTGLQLSEHVQVVCPNTNGTCLKSVSKALSHFTFPALKETIAHIHPNGQFWTVFGQNGQNGENYQKTLGTFFSRLQALTN